MPTPTHYLTVVLELPTDTSARQSVLNALPLFGQFQSARITAMYAGDAVTENELMEPFITPKEVHLIRERANQLPMVTLEA